MEECFEAPLAILRMLTVSEIRLSLFFGLLVGVCRDISATGIRTPGVLHLS